MLEIHGGRYRVCDGVNRRDFLRAGALGLSGLALSDLLRLRAEGAAPNRSAAKSVIFVFLAGGPSHIDMYDLKPEAPAEIRGEFKPIETNVPGMRMCELMPLEARIADKLAVVNGVQTIDTHSAWTVMTGYNEKDRRPVFGSTVSRLWGNSRDGLPTYVSLRGENGADPGEPAYLGAAHRPFTPDGPGLENLGLPSGLSLDRLEHRKELLRSLDAFRRNVDDQAGNLAGVDAYTKQALDIITSRRAVEAFDVSREPAKVRERYDKATRLLLAVRLVEAGVPVVTLSLAGTCIPNGDWDTHAGSDQGSKTNFVSLREKLPVYDRAIHAMITDLYDRGLDRQTLIVICGEFGRTPRINKFGGRDHWAPAGSVVFAGGGLKMGQAIGNTGRYAERAVDHTYTAQSVLATIYHVLGIDPATTIPNHNGRPMYLLDQQEKIAELV